MSGKAKHSFNLPKWRGLWAAQLSAGLSRLEVVLDETQQTQLLDYLSLLCKWNSVYNLTAVRDPQEMVSRQLLDSLSIVPWMRGPSILDVGSGAGLPAIPLAVALPDYQVVALDSNGKKTRFVQQVRSQLRLENLRVEQARVEDFRFSEGFATITSRGFADLHQMLSLTAHLRAPNGQWAAMKANLEEVHEPSLPQGCELKIVQLQVPDQPQARHLVLVS